MHLFEAYYLMSCNKNYSSVSLLILDYNWWIYSARIQIISDVEFPVLYWSFHLKFNYLLYQYFHRGIIQIIMQLFLETFWFEIPIFCLTRLINPFAFLQKSHILIPNLSCCSYLEGLHLDLLFQEFGFGKGNHPLFFLVVLFYLGQK